MKKLNSQERKDYSYALLSCSMQRRLVTVCPLAFGEVGVKKRVKEILNYKKPTFWVVLAAVAVCVIVAVCFLTNPKQGTTTTILLTNEAGKSENGVDAGNVASADEVNTQQETDAALQEALDKQREQAEAVKEASAAEQEKQASENPAGWVPMQNGNTTGHSIEVYNLDTATGQLVLTGSNTESFDENGNETYYRLDSRGQRVESTEEEYLQAWEAYGKDAQPIEFTTQQ